MGDIESKQQCLPNTDEHDTEISHRLANINTILVSGDTKAPIDFKIVYSSVKKRGINKFAEGFTIWKPVAPKDINLLVILLIIDLIPQTNYHQNPLQYYCVRPK